MIPRLIRLAGIVLHQDALDELVEQCEDHVGVARPGLGLADPLARAGDHPPQPIAVAAGSSLRPWLRSCRSTTSQLPKSWVARNSVTLPYAGAPPRLLAGQVVDVAVQHERRRSCRRNTARRTRGPSAETTARPAAAAAR